MFLISLITFQKISHVEGKKHQKLDQHQRFKCKKDLMKIYEYMKKN